MTTDLSTTQEKGSDNRRLSYCHDSAIVSVCNIKTTSSKPSDWLVGGVLRNKLGQCSGNQAFAAALDFPFVTLHCKPLRQQLWTGCCQTWSVNRVQYNFRLVSIRPFLWTCVRKYPHLICNMKIPTYMIHFLFNARFDCVAKFCCQGIKLCVLAEIEQTCYYWTFMELNLLNDAFPANILSIIQCPIDELGCFLF